MSVARFFASPALKLAGIGFLVLLLLIPMAMIDNLREEREHRRDGVANEIGQSVGAEQSVLAPVIRVPFVEDLRDKDGKHLGTRESFWMFAPKDMRIDTSLTVERRHRGIFDVPVYIADHDAKGEFRFDAAAVRRIAGNPDLGRAALLVPVSNARALRKMETMIAGKPLMLAAGVEQIGSFSAFAAPLDQFTFDQVLPFSLTLTTSGAHALHYIPVAGNTDVRLTAPWPHPGFEGGFLPQTRKIGDAGFDATWQVLPFNREIPEFWRFDNELSSVFSLNRFGVRFVEPVDVYFLNHRSAKYGVLFLVLTFAAFFLFETLGKHRVHAIQYLLVGAALAVFYLVLLACSEHLGFGTSYLIAAASMGLMISAYAASVMRSLKRAAVIGTWLGMLYGALYVMINLEDFALLMGAALTALVLALAMYLTRRVDWSGGSEPEEPLPRPVNESV